MFMVSSGWLRGCERGNIPRMPFSHRNFLVSHEHGQGVFERLDPLGRLALVNTIFGCGLQVRSFWNPPSYRAAGLFAAAPHVHRMMSFPPTDISA
ncbi:hypothetical protein [Sphingomonas abietis]|uniref:Uncharacterized protein n=1 Tax=Sphingomonas abietis TaxID=3012344 RepID=A0ABY7NMI5_9SPHN|nr:hypothetical protein [Sphingomonas abietis]WBO22736.1 hypothetical protein PBT88_00855 [Sphingomonas abietis]